MVRFEDRYEDKIEKQVKADESKKQLKDSHRQRMDDLQNEQKREVDVKAREELDKRLREKDQFLQKNKTQPKEKDTLTQQQKKEILPDIKSKAREKYLIQREEQQLDLFKRRLDDEKTLFKNVDLTQGEEKVQQINQGILHLGENKKEVAIQGDNYVMQREEEEGKKGDIKHYMDRYDHEDKVEREGQLWEQE